MEIEKGQSTPFFLFVYIFLSFLLLYSFPALESVEKWGKGGKEGGGIANLPAHFSSFYFCTP